MRDRGVKRILMVLIFAFVVYLSCDNPLQDIIAEDVETTQEEEDVNTD